MFDWLFGRTKFQFYEDSFARTRESTLVGIRDALRKRLAATNDCFLVVAHFPDCFNEIQDRLPGWGVDYEIVPRALTAEQLHRHYSENPSCRVLLALSTLLQLDETVELRNDQKQKICVIGVERHPFIQHDSQLELFCRQIPACVEFGYFLSFEDVVIKSLVNEASLRILDMFGMGENELITSNMISRRLKTVLGQNAKKYTTDFPADSAIEWIELNAQAND